MSTSDAQLIQLILLHVFVSTTDKISTAPGGSVMLDFFNDVDDFRTNLPMKYHGRDKYITIITIINIIIVINGDSNFR